MSDGSRRARASSPTRLPLPPARFPGKVAILCPLPFEHVLWDRKRELVSIESCPQTHSNDFEVKLVESRRSVSQISHSPKVWCLSLLSLSPLSRPRSSKQLTLALAPATTSGADDGTQFCPCRYPTVTNRHHLLGHHGQHIMHVGCLIAFWCDLQPVNVLLVVMHGRHAHTKGQSCQASLAQSLAGA